MLNLNLNINNVIRNILSSGLLPNLSLDFSTSLPNVLIGNGATGLVQKLDNTYQQFTSPSIRRTDRGAIFEPASKNVVYPSVPDNVTGYSLTNSFTVINNKISVIPGSTAKEYVSNGTTAILTQATNVASGSYGATTECLWCILETTATSQACYLTMEDATNSSTVMLNLNIGGLQNAQPSLGSSVAGTTNQLWGSINLGIGQNGGTLWLFMTSGTPITTGGTRKFRIRPNGASAPTSGWSVIIHHVQHEALPYPTSPILNATNTPNSRSAEDIKAPLTNGTYNVRYYLQDGTRIDRLGVIVSDGNLHIATDVCQMPALNSVSPLGITVQANQRIGYITKIEAWTPPTNLFLLGDSFAGTPTSVWTPYYMRVPRVFNNNSTFGGSTTQEADNWDGLSSHWGDVLIIMDGGVTSGDTPTTYLANVARMVARLTQNPKKWLFIETAPTGQVVGNEIGGAWYTNYAASMAAVQAAYPNNFVPTRAIMQTHGDGGANDNSDIANGWWPRSLQQDGLHPNNIGSQFLCQIIANALFNNAF